MKQYIDKADVMAEIERVLNSYDPNEITSGRYALIDLRNFLDTLEVKEVDLEKEEESTEDKHWQDVRERAAIAAMQGTISILSNSDRGAFRDIVVEGYSGNKRTYPNEIAEFSVACADALIKELKKEGKE